MATEALMGSYRSRFNLGANIPAASQSASATRRESLQRTAGRGAITNMAHFGVRNPRAIPSNSSIRVASGSSSPVPVNFEAFVAIFPLAVRIYHLNS